MVNNHGDRKSRIGLRDPFQMAELHGLYMLHGGYYPLTKWDDPPKRPKTKGNQWVFIVPDHKAGHFLGKRGIRGVF